MEAVILGAMELVPYPLFLLALWVLWRIDKRLTLLEANMSRLLKYERRIVRLVSDDVDEQHERI